MAVDNHPAVLELARRSPNPPFLIQADALALPFPPRSFDIAFCALAFHHLGFDASIQLLKSMDALTKRGFIVSDLRRDRPSLMGVQASLKLLGSDSITMHDGPASVRRSWNINEYRKMIALSGVQEMRVGTSWYFRVSLWFKRRDLRVRISKPLMHTENTIIIHGPRSRIFELAAAIENWPDILPHYREVFVFESSDDGNRKVVEMAAVRDNFPLAGIRFPVRWRSIQVCEPSERVKFTLSTRMVWLLGCGWFGSLPRIRMASPSA